MNKYIKVNEDISLTDVREGDQPSLIKYLNDEEVYANTLYIPYPYAQADADFFINLCRENEAEHGLTVNWAIRNTEGVMIGGIGRWMKSERGNMHKDEIGYWIAKPYRGKGLMTEVVKIFTDYWFQNSAVIRMEAVIFPQNKSSQRVVEKAGFEREAYCKHYHMKKGVPIDGIMYVRFKEEIKE
jgi:[ribosomal protein S5]-alanine N-acetyltransferase